MPEPEPYHVQTREFTGGAGDGPRLFISGSVHGDEFEPMAAARRLISMFDQDEQLLAGMRGTLVLAPVVNEPAFLRGHRTADDGLDLARICPGRPDGSISERVAHAFSKLIREADNFIDMHTGGTELAVAPLAGYKLHANLEVREAARRMAMAFNLPVVWATDPNLEGRSTSIARAANVPAIYVEYWGTATLRPEGVETYVEGCLNVMGVLGMLDRAQPENRVEHVIDDTRPSAGFMQICNPSPITGFFEPAVTPGEIVEKGQALGTVCNVLGDDRRVVAAENSGIVLVLRTFPRVREGETLGVVAELNP